MAKMATCVPYVKFLWIGQLKLKKLPEQSLPAGYKHGTGDEMTKKNALKRWKMLSCIHSGHLDLWADSFQRIPTFGEVFIS